ncbi:MAG: sulfotransferase family protein, partial [Nocardioides sp.]
SPPVSAQPDAFTVPADPDPMSYDRKVLFVAGAGRSGTSTMAGLMKIMGLHVPQPEVEPDETNPKGFAEPAWVVEHHSRLLREAVVQVSDSRPDAWFETGRVATREPERIKTAEWLEGHFAVNPELVVKDPRLSWFLSLWRVAAIRCGATPVFATMLRPPSEVVGSKQKYYANRLGSAHLAASWLNMLLHTERATRESVADGGRVFIRYADLLDDWTKAVMYTGEQLGLQHILHAKSERIRDAHRFVDPGLRRVSGTLDDLGLPKRLHELVAETWNELNKLADHDGDTPAVHEALDQLREGYVELYEESEAISRSSVVAAEQKTRRGRDKGEGLAGEPGPGNTADPAYVADKIPHGLRAAIPPGVRRGLRKAVGRER